MKQNLKQSRATAASKQTQYMRRFRWVIEFNKTALLKLLATGWGVNHKAEIFRAFFFSKPPLWLLCGKHEISTKVQRLTGIFTKRAQWWIHDTHWWGNINVWQLLKQQLLPSFVLRGGKSITHVVVVGFRFLYRICDWGRPLLSLRGITATYCW